MVCCRFPLIELLREFRVLECVCVERGPVFQTELLRCAQARILFDLLSPIVGFLNHLKFDCGVGIADAV